MVLRTKNYNLLLLTVQYVIQQCACVFLLHLWTDCPFTYILHHIYTL